MGAGPPHCMCVWRVCVHGIFSRPALQACRHRICWICSSSSGVPAPAVPPRPVFVQFWPLALRAEVPALASHVLALPAAGLSLHSGPWIFPGLVGHPAAAPVLRAALVCCHGEASVPSSSPAFSGLSHPPHAGACPPLMLPAPLSHWISVKENMV